MKKWLLSGFWFVCLLMLSPISAFAADTPLDKMEGYMKFDWGVIDDLSWGFKIYTMVMSIFIILLLVWLIVTIPVHIFKSLRAKAVFGDKAFWLRSAGIFIVLVLFMTTAYFSILKSLYNFTEKQKIGDTTVKTSMLVVPGVSTPWELPSTRV